MNINKCRIDGAVKWEPFWRAKPLKNGVPSGGVKPLEDWEAVLRKAANEYMEESLRRTEETISQALHEVQDTRMKFLAVTESQEQRKAVPNVDVDM